MSSALPGALLLGALAWAASRTGDSGSQVPAPPPGGAPPGAPGPEIDLSALGNITPNDPEAVQGLDVAGDISDSEPDYYDGQFFSTGKLWKNRGDWFRLFWLPASRVPLSELTSWHYEQALRVAFGIRPLTKGPQGVPISVGCPPTAQETEFIQSMQQLNDSVTTARVFIGIVAFVFEIIGSIWPAAKAAIEIGTKVGDLVTDSATGGQGGIEGGMKRAEGQLDQMRAEFEKLMLAEQRGYLIEWTLRPVLKLGGYNFNDLFHLTNEGELVFLGYRKDDPFAAKRWWDSQILRGADRPAVLRTSPDGLQYYDRNGVREIKSWWTTELGCARPLRERVNIRARVYRALDVIASLVFPYLAKVTVEGAPQSTQDVSAADFSREIELYDPPGLYSYAHPRALLVRGSVFPPDSEAVRVPWWYPSKQAAIDAHKKKWATPAPAVIGAGSAAGEAKQVIIERGSNVTSGPIFRRAIT